MIVKIEKYNGNYIVKYRKWYQIKWRYGTKPQPNIQTARSYAFTIEHDGAK